MMQDIQVEPGGHSAAIVIGCFDDVHRLEHVYAQEKPVFGAHDPGEGFQQGHALLMREVPERAAEKNDELAPSRQEFEMPGEICDKSENGQVPKIAHEAHRRSQQAGFTDVDRHVTDMFPIIFRRSFQEESDLQIRPAPDLDEIPSLPRKE